MFGVCFPESSSVQLLLGNFKAGVNCAFCIWNRRTFPPPFWGCLGFVSQVCPCHTAHVDLHCQDVNVSKLKTSGEGRRQSEMRRGGRCSVCSVLGPIPAFLPLLHNILYKYFKWNCHFPQVNSVQTLLPPSLLFSPLFFLQSHFLSFTVQMAIFTVLIFIL